MGDKDKANTLLPASKQVHCYHCDRDFNEKQLQSEWLVRTCPLCGSTLRVDEYDELGLKVLDDITELNGRINELDQRIHELETERRALSDCRRKTRKRKLALARSRYYVSEWYHDTHTPLSGIVEPGKHYDLEPDYDEGHRAFWLRAEGPAKNKETGWGISGEEQVYNAIAQEIADPHSPLHTSRLIANVIFHWKNFTGERKRPRAEADCLLLTRTHVVIVEVKHRFAHVNTHAPFTCTYLGLQRDGANATETVFRNSLQARRHAYEKDETTQPQLERLASAFTDEVSLYPRNRVCKAVIYVDALSFSTDCDRFSKRSFVGCCTPCDKSFVNALTALVADAEPVITLEELHKLAHYLEGKNDPADGRPTQEGGGSPHPQHGSHAQRRRRAETRQESAHARESEGQPPTEPAGETDRRKLAISSLRARAEDESSPLDGMVVIPSATCTLLHGSGSKRKRRKRKLDCIALTRSHAFLFQFFDHDAHVNASTASRTAFVGYPEDGAMPLDDTIGNDWNWPMLGYTSLNGDIDAFLDQMTHLDELGPYIDSSRIYAISCFTQPLTFRCEGDGFDNRVLLTWYADAGERFLSEMESVVEGASPIVAQAKLDKIAAKLSR